MEAGGVPWPGEAQRLGAGRGVGSQPGAAEDNHRKCLAGERGEGRGGEGTGREERAVASMISGTRT